MCNESELTCGIVPTESNAPKVTTISARSVSRLSSRLRSGDSFVQSELSSRQHSGKSLVQADYDGELPNVGSSLLEVRCGGFTTTRCLGSGSFGEVWAGVDETGREKVAMKFEKNTARPSLFHEVTVVSALTEEDQHPQGFAKFHDFCTTGNYNCMIMEMLGRTLKSVMRSSHGFGVQTTAAIAQQVLQRIEYLHSKCIVHRDIKPENFVFGVGEKIHHVYLIDFGLATHWWERGSNGKGVHVTASAGCKVGGTARYISVNTHNGLKQSRRDDLEAIGYMFLHMLKGALPWTGFDTRSPQYTLQVGMKKIQTTVSELCEGAPIEFDSYMVYVRGLSFKERPDYDKMYELFSNLREPDHKDHEFAWHKCRDERSFSAADLAPLLPRVPIAQPDDSASKGSRGLFNYIRCKFSKSAAKASAKIVPF